MFLTKDEKFHFIDIIKTKLADFQEINKIVLFGSFVTSNNPNDIDIAVIQNSKENFLTLSLRYRKVLRKLSKIIPIDIVPIKNSKYDTFLSKIEQGKIVYER